MSYCKKQTSKSTVPAHGTFRLNIPIFFKRVLQKGSLGLGESYMDGWWECERLDMFFHRALKHKLDEQLPHHVQDIVRIALARLVNLQSKNGPGKSAKRTMIWVMTFLP